MPIGTVDWVADGMMTSDIVPAEQGRYDLPIRNQFFHGSHPLGWVRHIELTVAGEAIPAEQTQFVIREQTIPLQLMRTVTDIWWQPREIAFLRFLPTKPLGPGRHDVECTFRLSTFFFTPEIDVDDRYPVMTLRLAARLDVATQIQEVNA